MKVLMELLGLEIPTEPKIIAEHPPFALASKYLNCFLDIEPSSLQRLSPIGAINIRFLKTSSFIEYGDNNDLY